jgi:hypothetical protein
VPRCGMRGVWRLARVLWCLVVILRVMCDCLENDGHMRWVLCPVPFVLIRTSSVLEVLVVVRRSVGGQLVVG